MFKWHLQIPVNADLCAEYSAFRVTTSDPKCADHLISKSHYDPKFAKSNPSYLANGFTIVSITHDASRDGVIMDLMPNGGRETLYNFFWKFENTEFTDFMVVPLEKRYDSVYYFVDEADNFQSISRLVIEGKIAGMKPLCHLRKTGTTQFRAGLLSFEKPMTVSEIDELLKPALKPWSIGYHPELQCGAEYTSQILDRLSSIKTHILTPARGQEDSNIENRNEPKESVNSVDPGSQVNESEESVNSENPRTHEGAITWITELLDAQGRVLVVLMLMVYCLAWVNVIQITKGARIAI